MRDGARQDGFTLVEVLVALGVLGLAMLSLVRLGGAQAMTAVELEQTTYADIVAENALIETLISATPPALGTANETVTAMGGVWQVARVAQRTAEPKVMLIGITVTGPDGETARLEGMRRDD
ncbi:MAG: type II secretion system minor pseudopilin GspI [Pacificimonas sp.]